MESVSLKIPGLEDVLSLYIHGDQDQFVSRQIRSTGIWEPYETSLVRELLQPGMVFVDVGANIGYFSVLAANAVGANGKVFAFEPDPENFFLLEASSALNGFTDRIEPVKAGLAKADGQGRLYLSEDNLGDHQIYAGEGDRNSLPINLYNGGDYLRPRLSQLDLLKVDTQGSEYEVMAGLVPLLSELAEPPRIILELTPYSLRQAGASGRALIELLGTLEQDFSIIDHVEHRIVRSSAAELAQWCDDVDACVGDQGFMNIFIGSYSVAPSGP